MSWEEFDLSLEDVAMLASLSMFGEAHVASLNPDGEDKRMINALNTSLSKSKYSTYNATYLSRAKYFDKGKWMNSSYQVDAFLAYCLSYFVFPS